MIKNQNFITIYRPPPKFKHLKLKNKRDQLADDRFAQIEKDNMRLI